MHRVIALLIAGSLIISLMNCSGKRKFDPVNPDTQSSARIYLDNNQIKEGIVIKRSGDMLYFVNAESHNKDSVNYNAIRRIEESSSIYDFEGYAIPVADIKREKGMGKTLTYGAGGLILGTAVGTAVGISLIAAGVDLDVPISMAVFGIAGAWMFGAKGSDRDFEDATYEVRRKRYQTRKAEMERQLKEERRKIEEQKRLKEDLMKKKKQ